jgi:hypothetical protein
MVFKLLHPAAEEGKLLLERGEHINGRNASNQTRLKRATERGNLDIVRYLRRLSSQLLELTRPVALHFPRPTVDMDDGLFSGSPLTWT